ncbi:hypothetical protein GOQ27_01575 [Clostridium sp. D2Q-11]|uniref:LiaF transmembrane domain-containing protein n=1 Tax=Anaeromonas frigoriresistens TaxID=2683708 RepID=A0A942UUL4_9FIRM|nr:DUF5668 domain-containing protein [Anaeromonas frigoriresistens]MBS4537131.1 hypothetical protein [Anaeromonas frigoriresistens]
MRKNLFGVIIILVGIILLLNANGILDVSIGSLISTFWPSVLILIGLFSLITNPASKTGGLIVFIIGVMFQLRNLDYFNIFEYLEFWPVVLILVGLWIIFSSQNKWQKQSKDACNPIAVFSGINLKNSSDKFKGGSATAIFGGIDLDLREAKIIDENEAVIDVFVAFGGLDIYVPNGWNVVVKGIPLFGGWSNKTTNKGNDKLPTLRINCFVMFGGFEIKEYTGVIN